MDLSVLIAARNEEWLSRTIDDVLKNARAETEVIAVLDGEWADPPIPDHPRVRLTHSATVVGQRGAINLAARMSQATYLMKLDAHCSVDEGFDVKLIEADREIGRPDLMQIPAMKNWHVFTWKCQACKVETYQGPKPQTCAQCKAAGPFERMIIWQPRRKKFATSTSPGEGGEVRTEYWAFDHNLKFCYWSAYKNRPEAQHDLADVMSNIGACFFLRRSYYDAIDGLDENHGSWGQVGQELSCKVWLGGGRQIVNKRTWFGHLFRTQGPSGSGEAFSFPYPMSGAAQDRAHKYAQEIWYSNGWKKQIHPLSWLVDRFKPAPGWHDPDGSARLRAVMDAGAAFALRQKSRLPVIAQSSQIAVVDADGASPPAPVGLGVVERLRENVAPDAMGLPSLTRGRAASSKDVLSDSDEFQVGRIAAPATVAYEVIDNAKIHPPGKWSNKPGVHDPVCSDLGTSSASGREAHAPIPALFNVSSPDPASGLPVNLNLAEDAEKLFSVKAIDREKLGGSHTSAPRADVRLGADERSQRSPAPSIVRQNQRKSCVFYTDNRVDPTIARAVQAQLRRVASGQIVCVSLAPMDFGDVQIVLPLERSVVSMFRQILAGIEATDSRWVYLTEHDCVYAPEHFEFTPPTSDAYFYNEHRWQVRASDGFAVHYLAKQVSGCVASRDLLLQHYRKRIAYIEAHGWDRNLGYEPGSNRRIREIDAHGAEAFFTERPNIDIRHDRNLSKSKWSVADFRDKRNARGWRESDVVPGWGRTRGRFSEFLADVAAGRTDETASASEAAAIQHDHEVLV